MEEIPAGILAAVPDDARPAVDRWWSGLAVAERAEAVGLWDERRERRFFTPQAGDSGAVDDWGGVPSVEGGRFVPHDDSVRMHEWLEDWQEYVLGHEEVVLLPRVVVVFRTFHICQGQPEAQAAVTAGQLEAGFRCPVGSSTCPMRRLQRVAPNRNLHMTPAAKGGWWVVAPWAEGAAERERPGFAPARAAAFPLQ